MNAADDFNAIARRMKELAEEKARPVTANPVPQDDGDDGKIYIDDYGYWTPPQIVDGG